jgi:hypothetical protein
LHCIISKSKTKSQTWFWHLFKDLVATRSQAKMIHPDVLNFIAAVNDLVYDFCDDDTIALYPKVYGVTNFNDRRLLHMIRYLREHNIELPIDYRLNLGKVVDKFADYVDAHDGKYDGMTLKVPIGKLRECSHDLLKK